MRPIYALALLTLAAGCGKKAAEPEAAAEAPAEEAAPAPAAMSAQMPDTKEAKAFAKTLVGTTVSNWSPLDGSGGGGELEYKEMTFDPSGSWAANAVLELGMDTVDCKESGTWAIDEAESKETATMSWKLDKTDCPSRETGVDLRVKMSITGGGQTKIMMR